MANDGRSHKPMRLAVFVSGGGTNLHALLDSCRDDDAMQIALVCSDRDDTGAVARASTAGVPACVFRDHSDAREILATLSEHHIDFIVLAGYLRLVPGEVVEAYDRRMINVHPALLPSFGGKGMYGQQVHRAVIEAGVIPY